MSKSIGLFCLDLLFEPEIIISKVICALYSTEFMFTIYRFSQLVQPDSLFVCLSTYFDSIVT